MSVRLVAVPKPVAWEAKKLVVGELIVHDIGNFT
jgi:hypothetical protein